MSSIHFDPLRFTSIHFDSHGSEVLARCQREHGGRWYGAYVRDVGLDRATVYLGLIVAVSLLAVFIFASGYGDPVANHQRPLTR